MAQQEHSDIDPVTEVADQVASAVAEGGAYEVIRKRLVDQGRQLDEKTRQLNESRLAEFGSSSMSVLARVRVRTENNCIARDIVQVGNLLIFGYNVFIGLKKETKREDVFSLFQLNQDGSDYSMEAVGLEGSFLSDSRFVNDFDELYRYYKHTRLVQLSVKGGRLLAGFQIGERLEDIRVFRWSVSADGNTVSYIDNRGERDIQLPPRFDFEWVETSREDFVQGRHPHVNILDKVFIETIGGDLTVKVEDNTEDGKGIYRESVEDKTQSLDDADYLYAAVGSLILLKVRPYREENWRYLVFNTLTQEVLRMDAIGASCVQLPEDHGVIFPGGYYLQTGEYKTFDGEVEGLQFKRMIRSPNGEDVLYIFYEPVEGIFGLFAYNLIQRQLQNPIYGHGYALSEDGTIVIFSAETEPTRVHPMQIWETPYVSDEFASQKPASQSFFGRVGNAELVRGISDLYSICRIVEDKEVSSRLYEELTKTVSKMFDAHYWLGEPEALAIDDLLKEVSATAELVIDEFEKVEGIRQQSAKAMVEAEQQQQDIIDSIRPENWNLAEDYIEALNKLRHQRGHLTTIKEYRYIDLERIEVLDAQVTDAQEQLSEQTVTFLADEQALAPYWSKIEDLDRQVKRADSVVALDPVVEIIENTASGLDLLSELMGTLKVTDANVRTRIIDAISEVYSKLNQSKATARNKYKSLGSKEAVAQFSAQFKLFSQSITNALGMAVTPERCDEQLSRLIVQLEELESQFSDYDEFLADIMAKREEIYESFESHKQQLLDEQQRKAQSVSEAGARIIASIERRSLKFTEADELNTYFASDAMVLKVRDLVERLRQLDGAVQADDLESRFKMIKDQAARSLRDKSDIYEDGGNIIKLGPRHKFSVNNQELDLTIIPRNGELNMHLTGTNYFEPIENAELLELNTYWDISLESESLVVYRAEYLASSILRAAQTRQEAGTEGQITMDQLRGAMLDSQAMKDLVRVFAAPRYKEGYEKGIHDHDAALILKQLLPVYEGADLLRYDPLTRGLAQIFWANIEAVSCSQPGGSNSQPERTSAQQGNSSSYNVDSINSWRERARSALQMRELFTDDLAVAQLVSEVKSTLTAFLAIHPISLDSLTVERSASYLVEELGRERFEFISSKYAEELAGEFKRTLDESTWRQYQSALDKLKGRAAERWNLTFSWLQALVRSKNLEQLGHYIPEAVALINGDGRLSRRATEVDLEIRVSGLLGEHPTIETRDANRTLAFSLDSFLLRLEKHHQEVIPGYHRYLDLRQRIIDEGRASLRIEEFKAKPLSSFVRNRLINESYLPLIGDNLAKQMGTVGENKRTDLMGLLMMISPPGYGKTTLMEYVANRIGLIFMKINCPSLGHDVLSLDPAQAPNATARQELEKLNLGLEMGNNVMLYLDDIQHTDPEFLQKFISLCDGTRRIEGVWKGKTRTYDMRGKKFCVVMAGNPYTESGEAFRVPDMLANRADIYNLGDILGGMDEQFSLSYIENCLTSNPVLAPLATREMSDVYKLIDMARGKNVATTDLSHQYSGAEINEIKGVLQKLLVVQEVVLKINQQYIASAAQDDTYRTAPSFKLQGSYRNMNKMAEKVSAVMNEEELRQMITDHYLGEAQLLTSGAEENLLRLAELRGDISDQEQARWQQIKKDFLRNKAIGGDDTDVGGKVVAQLADLVEGVQLLGAAASQGLTQSDSGSGTEAESKSDSGLEAKIVQLSQELIHSLDHIGKQLINQKQPYIEVINQPMPGIDKILRVLAHTYKHSMVALVEGMDKKFEFDKKTHEEIEKISAKLMVIDQDISDLNDEQ
ncbi:DNA repair ATPase [Motiliproteus sp. MSK22-1]|uniref:DNA repair ATPase n=1 Tax=Motiliproteus sp. MSK22-1 TaxID=1897630 RepID=UPI000975E900|nr:DNA repair ATPase [Motiliproteus sp. MSK22-1]OMH33744.1 DNA repair protein [Motiliproteus sp. MSK22-1]